ncbi:MAG: tRNA (5-methylaminomethyl-2-thiouridine)(34)-methyltransferase MnmD [Paludibacter sp.]|nr:tRNA (5-methylaminomethyl-2-thiouridine)(34)-methyltransferase MnmD [Paludibacter sp.]
MRDILHENTDHTSIRLTEDGSHTLYVSGIDECYHSSHGAIQESKHIFIEAALNNCKKTELTVFEVGFGTGLNAFLTCLEAERRGLKVHYICIEKYPVPIENVERLNFPAVLCPEKQNVFMQMHCSAWNEKIPLSDTFGLLKIKGDFTSYLHTDKYDVVYFDAFSPDKQPEMWSDIQFGKIFEACNPGAVLTTYCAKGVVRRTMQSTGFSVERLPGPPGKREMLRAIKE